MSQIEDPFFLKPRSIEEVADWFGCQRRFLVDEIHAGRLRGRKVSPKLIRIQPADLREWLDKAATTEKASTIEKVNA
jgi:excisionase family DNA binding protein